MAATARLQPHYALELVRSPYLESGWLQHGNYAPLGELTYVPSTLAYGSKQAGGEAQGFVSFVNGLVAGAEALTAPRPSNAIVNRYFPPTLRTRSLNGFESGSPIYAADPGLPGAKKCQATNAPSRYTGLLALFVQAVYGTAPRRYATGENGGLSIDGVGLKFEGTDSHWLCWFPQTEPEGVTKTLTGASAPSPSDGNNGDHWHDTVSKKWYGPKKAGAWGEGYWLGRKYWLCQLVDDRLTFAQVETIKPQFDPSATGADADKIHATLLAHSKIGRVSKSIQVGRVKGGPLAYGWHSNTDGSEARVVCHETAAGALRKGKYYSVKVAGNAQGVPSSASLTLEGEGEWDIRPGQHALWLPDFFLGKQVALKPVTGNGFGTNGNYESPAYVHWDGSGFKLYSIKGCATSTTVSTTGEAGFTDNFGTVMFDATDGYSVSDSVGPTITSQSAGTTNGVYPDGWWGGSYGHRPYEWDDHPLTNETMITDYRVGTPISKDKADRVQGGTDYSGQPWYWNVVASWDYTGGAAIYYTEHQNITRTKTYWNGTTSLSTGLLIVPFDSCDTVATGVKSTTYHTLNVIMQGGWWAVTKYNYTMYAEHAEYNGDVLMTYCQWQNGGQATFDIYNNKLPPPPGNVGPAYEEWMRPIQTGGTEVTASSVSYVLHTPHTVEDIPVPEGSALNNYFVPDIGPSGDPSINPFYVLGSAGGSYTYSGSYGESGESDWPGGVPSGWA